jgi:ADP-L-glycero-D-manno-heptose 6-epimerase
MNSNPRLVVTGAAGFIGSNIVKALNARGHTNIIAVDDLSDGDKCRNLTDLHIADYVHFEDFYNRYAAKDYGSVDAIFHEGACSDTMQNDGRYMMRVNYECTRDLFVNAQAQGTRLLYASSAATYGNAQVFKEAPEFEGPLNVYGYSKLLLDQYLRQHIGVQFERAAHQVVGFRYFNVYGSREQHKGRMASVAFHQFHQFQKDGKVRLFGAYGGYAAGAQVRDFVSVNDVVAVNLWFFDHPEKSGLFNLGTGQAQPFNDVALAVVNGLARQAQGLPLLSLAQAVQQGLIDYVDFPPALVGKYQCFTQADLSKLRAAGCDHAFANVQAGVSDYMLQMDQMG